MDPRPGILENGGRDSPRPRRRRAGGFTLIEVLLAIALLAALLAALNQFVFAITEAWTKDRDRFVFIQHTRAVTRHIDEMLQAAINSSRSSGTTTGSPAIDELHVPGGTTADMLAFDLPNGDRLFTWPTKPLPEVRCGLAVTPDDGLVVYWKSRLEEDFATADMRMTVISPFVTGISYDYYDTDKQTWSNEEKLQEDATGAYQTPQRVRLKFARNGQEVEQIIALAVTKEGVPAY